MTAKLLNDILNNIEIMEDKETNTVYISSNKDDVRLIYRDGEYVGWYCPEKEEEAEETFEKHMDNEKIICKWFVNWEQFGIM